MTIQQIRAHRHVHEQSPEKKQSILPYVAKLAKVLILICKFQQRCPCFDTTYFCQRAQLW